MTIKDVEKLTGLTAKSIRYYESKNLIAVARNEDIQRYEEHTYLELEEFDQALVRLGIPTISFWSILTQQISFQAPSR